MNMKDQYIVIVHNEDNYETSGVETGIFNSLEEATEYVKNTCNSCATTIEETDGLYMVKTEIDSNYTNAHLEWKDDYTEVVFSTTIRVIKPFNIPNG